MKEIYSFLLAFLIFSSADAQSFKSDNLSFSSDYSFVENVGQFENRGWENSDKIKFAVKLGSVFTYFTNEGLTYRFENYKKFKIKGDQDTGFIRKNLSELINIQFLNANTDVEIVAENRMNHYNSYGIKNYTTNEVRNVSNVKGYSKITYKNIYDNIDIEYTFSKKGGIKYNIILHPGASVSDIRMKYSTKNKNTGEKTNIKLNKVGQIEINTSLGKITEHKPVTFYDNSNESISSNYKFNNNILTF